MPFFEGRTPRRAASRSLVLAHRRCRDLDYSLVTKGRITCAECGNEWRLRISIDKSGAKFYHWLPRICPGCQTAAEACDHYRFKARYPLVFPDADEDARPDEDIW